MILNNDDVNFDSASNLTVSWFDNAHEQRAVKQALYYFTLLACSVIRGKSSTREQERLGMLKDDLLSLRQCLNKEKAELQGAIDFLLNQLEEYHEEDRGYLIQFIYKSWPVFCAISATYRHQEPYFSDHRYGKIRDRVRHYHYFRLWWWRRKAIKMILQIDRGYERIKDWLLWN